MRRFTALYAKLDATGATHAKLAALVEYFRAAPPRDAAWAAFFLTGRKMKRLVRSRDLRAAAQAAAGVPEWLFAASHEAVGDLAETIALLLPPPRLADDRTLSQWIEEELAPLADLSPEEVQMRLRSAWDRLPRDGRFVFNKLITGEFRVGAARQLVVRALALAAEVPAADVAHRLVGSWTPGDGFWSLLSDAGDAAHRPYPFLLAHALEDEPSTLGARAEWQVEWKWDGIRAQLVARPEGTCVWTRGEEIVTDSFPELVEAANRLPRGTVIDGEVLVWAENEVHPRPFASLQRRLNRKSPGPKLRRDAPVVLVAFDLLEHEGRDIRGAPLRDRRARLETLLPIAPSLTLSPLLGAGDWNALELMRDSARDRKVEGLVLKRLDSGYEAGRVRGIWWKWKVEPHRIDAVLVYAQPGHGRRAGLFTDYTFAVWQRGMLVPFAKAYTGLRDDEIRQVDAWIRRHTIERFGPVRRVEPSLVFELAFERVQASTRHKSGIAVRFPRITRWRTDKPAAEADTLEALQALARDAIA